MWFSPPDSASPWHAPRAHNREPERHAFRFLRSSKRLRVLRIRVSRFAEWHAAYYQSACRTITPKGIAAVGFLAASAPSGLPRMTIFGAGVFPLGNIGRISCQIPKIPPKQG